MVIQIPFLHEQEILVILDIICLHLQNPVLNYMMLTVDYAKELVNIMYGDKDPDFGAADDGVLGCP